MKSLRFFFLLLALAAPSAWAGNGLGFEPSDTVRAVLERQTGQSVELHLKTGEKIGGKLAKVGDNGVHLTALTGSEFYEAFVLLNDVSAVVVRAAGK